MKSFKDVFIVGGARTPFVKSFTHYTRIKNQELNTAVLKNLVDRFNLKDKVIGDVALGSVILNTTDWNLARESVLGSGLHPHTPGYNIQRACGTGLETIWQIALKIAAGQIENGIGGGSDTNSDLPVIAKREFAWKLVELQNARTPVQKIKSILNINLKDLVPQFPGVMEPRTGLSMGQHCEKMVQEWQIQRETQDELAFVSHMNGAKAYERNFFNDLVFDFKGLKRDTLLRADTTREKLARLKPAFDFTGKGTLTAGNSTPLTDGASAVLLASEESAKTNNWPLLARFVDAQVSAVDFVKGEGLLMAPTQAVAKLLHRNQLKLQDFDFYEIHEAFAGQVLCTLKAWESDEYCQTRLNEPIALGPIDRDKMNVNGGSVALGHPFAATGGRIVASLAKTLNEKGKGRGLISICTAGGMGVAAILEK